MATDPLKPDSLPQPEVVALEGQFNISLTFQSPADLGSYRIIPESCPDLQTWIPPNPMVSETPIPTTDRLLEA